jgi:hypothetical protein
MNVEQSVYRLPSDMSLKKAFIELWLALFVVRE